MSRSGSMRFLVTAGGTREKIDAVRDWGNIFSGNTGYGIAQALVAAGDVDLLTSNRQHLRQLADLAELGAGRFGRHRITGMAFNSYDELRGALSALMQRERYSAIFMTAAVSDYRPSRVYEVVRRHALADTADGREVWIVRSAQAGKVKSTYGQIAVLGKQTEKLVDLFRGQWAYRGLLVKFKLEVGLTHAQLLEAGTVSLIRSGADYLVANTLDMVDGPDAGAYLIGPDFHRWVRRSQLPQDLLHLVRSGLPLQPAPSLRHRQVYALAGV